MEPIASDFHLCRDAYGYGASITDGRSNDTGSPAQIADVLKLPARYGGIHLEQKRSWDWVRIADFASKCTQCFETTARFPLFNQN